MVQLSLIVFTTKIIHIEGTRLNLQKEGL